MSSNNPFTLDNKTILVTGSSSGIGAAIAIECSKMGAILIITGRDEQRLQQTFCQLSAGKKHQYIIADFSDTEGIESFVSELPKIDGIVHCAGFLKKLPLKFINKKAWDETLLVNLYAPALLSQQIVKKNLLMEEGSVVFISSIAASVASFGNIAYMASKGAVNSLSRGMALELAGKKIRVNTIQPALIKTNLTEKALSEDDLENYRNKFPLGRFGKPEEVAYAAIYLLSDASQWVTGISLTVDGGVTLR
jgi:NAD(P)-dependent dehydrogenase (short-subunit alcohol dehydrogenase family)